MTTLPLPWDPPYPWDEHLERIKDPPARDDDDKREWIEAHLELRFWMRFLTVYSDLSRHGGVEWDPETEKAWVARYKRKDIDEAIKYGDERQLREAVAQICEVEAVAPLLKLKRQRGGGAHHRGRKMDEAVEDFYFIRGLLYRTYLGADEEQMSGWREKIITIISDYHDLQTSLSNRLRRKASAGK